MKNTKKTIVTIVAVVAVISIIVGITIPVYTKTKNDKPVANETTVNENVSNEEANTIEVQSEGQTSTTENTTETSETTTQATTESTTAKKQETTTAKKNVVTTTKSAPKQTTTKKAVTTTKKAVKNVSPKDVQSQVNAYIKSKGIPVNDPILPMTPSNSSWSERIARGQEDLNSGYTLGSCKQRIDADVRNYKNSNGSNPQAMYCYYDNDFFYILFW